MLRKVTKGCKATRTRVQRDAAAFRKAEREKVNREIQRMRDKAQTACERRRARVRKSAKTAAELARAERDERIRLARELSGIERKRLRKLAAAETRAAAREKRRESDDEVASNLDRELIPIWRRVKRQIKGSPRKSRTEAFLQYLEENQSEVWAMREQRAAAELDDLAAEEEAYYRAQREAVPF